MQNTKMCHPYDNKTNI